MIKIGKSIFLSLAILLVLACPKLLAGSLTGELDKTEGTLDDTFVYTLSIQGRAAGEPDFPKIDGLQIERSGTSQNISVINGKMTRELQYQYILRAEREGKYTIPPLAVEVDQERLQTLPLELIVRASGSNTPGAQGANKVPLFLERHLTRDKVYVGEALQSVISFGTRVKILAAEPDFRYPDSFTVHAFKDEDSFSKDIDGQTYSMTELRAILIPNKPGSFTLPPATLALRIQASQQRRQPQSFFDDFWGQSRGEEKRLRTASTKLEVLPLPSAGRRADFSGLVGQFQANLLPIERRIQVGDNVGLAITIEGSGSTQALAEPELRLPEGLKYYRDKANGEDQYDKEKGIEGKRTLRYALVAQKPGTFSLGQISIQYFDPQQKAYRDLSVDLGQIEVQGQASQSQNPAPPAGANTKQVEEPAKAANSSSQAVMPEKKSEPSLQSLIEPWGPADLVMKEEVNRQQVLLAAVLLLLSFLVGFALRLRFGQKRSPSRKLQQKKACQKAKEQLRSLLQNPELSATVFASQAQAVIRECLSGLWLQDCSAFTLKDWQQAFAERKLAASLGVEFFEVWQLLDHFAFSDARQGMTRDTVMARVQALLAEVYQQCLLK